MNNGFVGQDPAEDMAGEVRVGGHYEVIFTSFSREYVQYSEQRCM